MSLYCVYHPNHEMRVVSTDDAAMLVASGEWYYHPLEAKAAKLKEVNSIRNEDYEKPIRQRTRKRRSDGEYPSE